MERSPMLHSEAIDPDGVEWTRVDEKYITVKLITGITGWAITLLIVLAPLVFDALGWWTIPGWLKWPVSTLR